MRRPMPIVERDTFISNRITAWMAFPERWRVYAFDVRRNSRLACLRRFDKESRILICPTEAKPSYWLCCEEGGVTRDFTSYARPLDLWRP
jgi:hypothetical protein